ncbi:MAG: Molybdopterin synthase catalytic subunit [Chloroflexi bacterium AL-W]|nr:Molybdopterin synthase catalytic subunit [Chloroflexi bacterium AL-N1]NOK70230.1 Molybdopterin synthase catalytic subunit [Chloroflexi bacterium AL-N10]NOK77767.1 Molybdopterin synthase catalytic subunit [Chloroflexi bacterium AL-N5]NOK84776.1 Molybdopterin synthase catalytic subunit [Chloroflexi bacterium AL-W]NOK92383.1 Molybdopterin synthase catalytic subunit [Chloroflexi bacterium AL-N15]
MEVVVHYFAGHRDITGCSEERIALAEGATVGMLWEQLIVQYPRLAGYTGSVLYAVNQEFSTLETPLSNGDEIAFLPPVSGGVPSEVSLFRITQLPLDPTPLVLHVQSPDMGALVTFTGIVRNHFGGKATAYLEYEAYEAMAVPVLERIAAEAQQTWRLGKIAIHHRIGRLEIGETAVLIVVAAPHRHEAFEAAESIMNRIKQIAPIWKREIWSDGTSEWVGGEHERKAHTNDKPV